jgi:hypothetical protein
MAIFFFKMNVLLLYTRTRYVKCTARFRCFNRLECVTGSNRNFTTDDKHINHKRYTSVLHILDTYQIRVRYESDMSQI